jgi:hypothetical protein
VVGVGTFLAVSLPTSSVLHARCLCDTGCIQRCPRLESQDPRASRRKSHGRSARRRGR